MKSCALLLAVSLLAAPALADDVVITVGPGGQFQRLTDAVVAANADPDPSDSYVINLALGTYLNDFPDPIIRPMTIQTDPAFAPARAVLKATVPLPNQKGILLTFASLTVHGLIFTGARIADSTRWERRRHPRSEPREYAGGAGGRKQPVP